MVQWRTLVTTYPSCSIKDGDFLDYLSHTFNSQEGLLHTFDVAVGTHRPVCTLI